jgi:YidC/Oxa1 family membrane protein insertase
MIGDIFNTILYQPLFNALVLLYEYIPGKDFGVAVIVLTVLIRFLLYPLMAQSIRSQKVLSELQPKIQEVQKKYSGNKAEQSKAIMELYKKEKFNPFGGCLPLLIQLPILIALYQVFWKGFDSGEFVHLYSFVQRPGAINPFFLGMINLSEPSIILAILAGISQFIQSKMMMPGSLNSQQKGQAAQFSQTMQKQMIYLLPVFTLFILWRLPAAVGLYWTVTSVFSIVQQYFIYSPAKKKAQNPQVPKGT